MQNVGGGATLEKSLEHWFGHSQFRDGQEDVIQAVLSKRDCAVFWATGRGKSLCYQLPALHTGRVVFVISPLISLMQDQVRRLNFMAGRGGRKVATFLGSSQTDRGEEALALKGEYRLVYVSPEKLLGSGFIDAVANLHKRAPLALVAVDEAHCVSEWGHDFRPEYRSLHLVRSKLPGCPIMALTATAVPQVQNDIVSNLQLANPFVALRSFDRPNLAVGCVRRAGKGVRHELISFIETQKASPQPTIVYAPTRGAVNEVYKVLLAAGLKVGRYFAGNLPPPPAGRSWTPEERDDLVMSHQDRTSVHEQFMTGELPIVVATIAFGMGIDKPDIRRVVHWGAPKTVEEYYQQIGRAGRDGAPAECTMYFSQADFSNYNSDFYLGRLSDTAKTNVLKSIDALRAYAEDSRGCRRLGLLKFFGESPPFTRCGDCDNCKNVNDNADDLTRDFSAAAAVVLLALWQIAPRQPSWSELAKGLTQVGSAAFRRKTALDSVDGRWTVEALKDLTSELCNTKPPIVARGSFKGEYRTFDVFSLADAGRNAMARLAANPPQPFPIMLPVPAWLRSREAELAKKAEALEKELLSYKTSVAKLPTDELKRIKSGCKPSPETEEMLRWHRELKRLREVGREAVAGHLEDLHKRLADWRSAEAIRLHLAPADVLKDHLLHRICYVRADDVSALEAAGMRASREAASAVAAIVGKWKAEQQEIKQQAAGDEANGGGTQNAPAGGAQEMDVTRLPPPQRWQLAVYKGKPGKPSPWEASYEKFGRGDSVQAIALQGGAKGQAVKEGTIVAHLFEALTFGKPVDLPRLAGSFPFLNRAQWEQLASAEARSGQDVVTNDKLAMTELLATFLPAAAKPGPERSEAEKEVCALWFDRVKLYLAFRRTGIVPCWRQCSPTKRAKLAGS